MKAVINKKKVGIKMSRKLSKNQTGTTIISLRKKGGKFELKRDNIPVVRSGDIRYVAQWSGQVIFDQINLNNNIQLDFRDEVSVEDRLLIGMALNNAYQFAGIAFTVN